MIAEHCEAASQLFTDPAKREEWANAASTSFYELGDFARSAAIDERLALQMPDPSIRRFYLERARKTIIDTTARQAGEVAEALHDVARIDRSLAKKNGFGDVGLFLEDLARGQ